MIQKFFTSTVYSHYYGPLLCSAQPSLKCTPSHKSVSTSWTHPFSAFLHLPSCLHGSAQHLISLRWLSFYYSANLEFAISPRVTFSSYLQAKKLIISLS